MDTQNETKSTNKATRKREPAKLLDLVYNDINRYEICLDEVGRGCLFGPAYIAAVVLPKDGSFDLTDIKDSKKFSSKKKIKERSDYIKQHAIVYDIQFVESQVIDEINILQAVMRGMHNCIRNCLDKLKTVNNGDNFYDETMAVIDGNYFNPYQWYEPTTESFKELSFVTVEQGDSKYAGIAAASILAKVARDEYICELCEQYPYLNEQYGLEKNVGYGTKQHMAGIKQYGITGWHRKSYSPCKIDLKNPAFYTA
jgi:ribonuclease HII